MVAHDDSLYGCFIEDHVNAPNGESGGSSARRRRFGDLVGADRALARRSSQRERGRPYQRSQTLSKSESSEDGISWWRRAAVSVVVLEACQVIDLLVGELRTCRGCLWCLG